MECGSIGIMFKPWRQRFSTLMLRSSSGPLLQHSITPIRRYSTHPPIQLSNNPFIHQPSPAMPSIPVIMPQLGESIAEATVVNLLVQVGDQVRTDQDITEVETSKATMNVAAPCTGRVEKLLVKLNESYPVGAVLGYLEASKEDAARLGLDVPMPAKNGEEPEGQPDVAVKPHGEAPRKGVEPTVRGLPVPANAAGASYMSPRMKARMIELGLHAADLAGLPGSGAAGRVTIQDFEKFVSNLEKSKPRACASRLPTLCAAAGHARWPRLPARFVLMRCCGIARRVTRVPARHCTRCARWRSRSRRTARRPAA